MSNPTDKITALANDFEEVCAKNSLRAMIWWHLRLWSWWSLAVVVGIVKEPVSFARSFVQGSRASWRAFHPKAPVPEAPTPAQPALTVVEEMDRHFAQQLPSAESGEGKATPLQPPPAWRTNGSHSAPTVH